MFSFFPSPVEDEALFSLLARTFHLSGFRSFIGFLQALFNGHRLESRGLYPIGIEMLSNYLPKQSRQVRKSLEELTVLPYFRPFMSTHGLANFHKLRRAYATSGAGQFSTGLLASRVPWNAEEVRFCVVCRQEQLHKFGHSAWLRSHQLPGVRLCWLHRTSLSTVRLPRQSVALPADIGDVQTSASALTDQEIWLAEASQILLSRASPQIPSALRRHVYRTRAQELGFGNRNHLSKEDFSEAIREIWGVQELASMGLPLPNKSHRTWLTVAIASQDRSLSPLAHLLLIRTLFGSVDVFFDAIKGTPKQLYMSEAFQSGRGPARRRQGIRPGADRHAILLAYLKSASSPSRSGFRKHASAAYAWLYHHNKGWMDSQFERVGAKAWATSGQYRKRKPAAG